MSKRNIDIDRVQIRFRGVSPRRARSAIKEVGRDLLDELSAPADLSGQRTTRIDAVDAGTVQVASGAAPVELRSQIAKRIAASIKANLK